MMQGMLANQRWSALARLCLLLKRSTLHHSHALPRLVTPTFLGCWSVLLNDALTAWLLHRAEHVQHTHTLHPVTWVTAVEQRETSRPFFLGKFSLVYVRICCVCVCVCQQSRSYLTMQAFSYLTSSIFLCLLNNQSDSEQPDISHPLVHCRTDLHIKSYTPGLRDSDGRELWGGDGVMIMIDSATSVNTLHPMGFCFLWCVLWWSTASTNIVLQSV